MMALIDYDLFGQRRDKVATAIQRIRSFCPPEGYYLAFSGGKDSVVIKALCDMAGVPYDAHYNVTTVDPPELVRFIMAQHPDVVLDRPEMPMRRLIVAKLTPPTRIARYCCAYFKERGGVGRVVMTGVRWAESQSRRVRQGLAVVQGGSVSRNIILNDDNDASRRMVEQCYRTRKTLVNPIVDWLDEDVWEFIGVERVPYCCLYDEGFTRLGCVCCPLGGYAAMRKDGERWPALRRVYVRAFEEMLAERLRRGKSNDAQWCDGESVYRWWTGQTLRDDRIEGQLEMEGLDNA